MDSAQIGLALTLGAGEIVDPSLQHWETDTLRQELLRLDVDRVRWASSGAAPTGSRGLDLIAAGSLIVQLTPALDLLTAVVAIVQAWVQRRAGRRVRVEIDGDTLEITGAADDDVKAVVSAFLRRHAGDSTST